MKIMINVLIMLLGVYLLSCFVLYYFQDKLIFFPPAPQEDVYESVSQNEIQISELNKKIHGWDIKVNETKSQTILYFGGNAQDVVYLNFEASEFNVKQLIAINHPGYGKSAGQPTQISIYKNALEVYDWAIKKYQLNPKNIVVMGRSLGSSVATYLAANRQISGLILITPFDSIENIAANQYKYFPIKLLMKHSFPTIDYIGLVTAPTLMLAAERDEIIAEENLANLKQAAGENNRLIRYENVGHNTIQEHNEYYAEINKHIQSL